MHYEDGFYHYGNFYRLYGRPCRSTLEVVNRKADDPNRLLCRQAEVVVVMMNPGSSHPVSNNDGPQKTPGCIGPTAHLTPACPDPAQEAIRKLMRCKGLGHARVLNLSDVREPKSEKFLKSLVNGTLPDDHSIFDEKRRVELTARLTGQSIVAKLRSRLYKPPIVIVGWGYDKRLGQLSRTAYDTMISKGVKVLGCNPRFLFAYPHPIDASEREEWIDKVISNWPR